MSAALTRRCREALAVSGIYQRLGVPSEDIYFQPTRDGAGGFYPTVVAEVDGSRFVEWQIPIYGSAGTVHALLAEWAFACAYWNSLPDPARADLVDDSDSRAQAPDFIVTCAASGHVFKEAVAAENLS